MDFGASARTLSVKNFRTFPPPHFGNESSLSLLKSDSYGIDRFSIIFGIRIVIISSQYITDKLLSISNYLGIIIDISYQDSMLIGVVLDIRIADNTKPFFIGNVNICIQETFQCAIFCNLLQRN